MGLDKVARDSVQAFLSEEFYINIFVKMNIFMISTSSYFS